MAVDASIVCSDALDFLRSFPPGSVDCIVTDPPYSSLEAARAIGTTTRLQDWFPVVSPGALKTVLDWCAIALKPDGHLYVFCDWKTSRLLPDDFQGLQLRNVLVWDKMKMGTGYHYRRSNEMIHFYAGKKKRKLNDLGVPDVLHFRALGANQRSYPTEKPVALINRLLRQSTKPGDLVIDPFCGSGSAAEAALLAGCRFQGCDISPRAVDLTRARINNFCRLQNSLFPEV